MRVVLKKGACVADNDNERVREKLEECTPPPKTFWKTVTALGPGIMQLCNGNRVYDNVA